MFCCYLVLLFWLCGLVWCDCLCFCCWWNMLWVVCVWVYVVGCCFWFSVVVDGCWRCCRCVVCFDWWRWSLLLCCVDGGFFGFVLVVCGLCCIFLWCVCLCFCFCVLFVGLVWMVGNGFWYVFCFVMCWVYVLVRLVLLCIRGRRCWKWNWCVGFGVWLWGVFVRWGVFWYGGVMWRFNVVLFCWLGVEVGGCM